MRTAVSLEKAWLYERHRLPYAPKAIDDLLADIEAVTVVADIGAGTGQLARCFSERVDRVYAVEPDASMRTVGIQVLDGHRAVRFINGTAEHTTLPDDLADLIVVGSAYHRFHAEACAEFRRVLRLPAIVALFSYSFTDRDYADMLFPKLAALPQLAERISTSWPKLPIEALFTGSAPITHRYPQTVQEPWEAFYGAACAGIEAPEQGDPEFDRFTEINREVFDAFAIDGKISMKYETCLTYGPVPIA